MIVAINTDPKAPIFDFAHIGIVADALQLLPALADAFRRRLAASHSATGFIGHPQTRRLFPNRSYIRAVPEPKPSALCARSVRTKAGN